MELGDNLTRRGGQRKPEGEQTPPTDFSVFTETPLDDDKPKYPTFFAPTTSRQSGTFRVSTPSKRGCFSMGCLLIVLLVLFVLSVVGLIVYRSFIAPKAQALVGDNTAMPNAKHQQHVAKPQESKSEIEQAATTLASEEKKQPKQKGKKPKTDVDFDHDPLADVPPVVGKNKQKDDYYKQQKQAANKKQNDAKKQPPKQQPPVQKPKQQQQQHRKQQQQQPPVQKKPKEEEHNFKDDHEDSVHKYIQKSEPKNTEPVWKRKRRGMSPDQRKKTNLLMSKAREQVARRARLSLVTIENHATSLNYWIQLAAEKKKAFTIVHYSSIPHFDVPNGIKPEMKTWKEVQPFITDTNYLLAAAYLGVASKIIWVRAKITKTSIPGLSFFITLTHLVGTHTFNIGIISGTELFGVDDAKFSKGYLNYAPTNTLTNAKQVTIVVVNAGKKVDFQIAQDEQVLVDVDLSYYGITNPFKDWINYQLKSGQKPKLLEALLQLANHDSYCVKTVEEGVSVASGIRAIGAFSDEYLKTPPSTVSIEQFIALAPGIVRHWCAGEEKAKSYLANILHLITDEVNNPRTNLIDFLYIVRLYPDSADPREMQRDTNFAARSMQHIYSSTMARPQLVTISRSVNSAFVPELAWPDFEEATYSILTDVFSKNPPKIRKPLPIREDIVPEPPKKQQPQQPAATEEQQPTIPELEQHKFFKKENNLETKQETQQPEKQTQDKQESNDQQQQQSGNEQAASTATTEKSTTEDAASKPAAQEQATTPAPHGDTKPAEFQADTPANTEQDNTASNKQKQPTPTPSDHEDMLLDPLDEHVPPVKVTKRPPQPKQVKKPTTLQQPGKAPKKPSPKLNEMHFDDDYDDPLRDMDDSIFEKPAPPMQQQPNRRMPPRGPQMGQEPIVPPPKRQRDMPMPPQRMPKRNEPPTYVPPNNYQQQPPRIPNRNAPPSYVPPPKMPNRMPPMNGGMPKKQNRGYDELHMDDEHHDDTFVDHNDKFASVGNRNKNRDPYANRDFAREQAMRNAQQILQPKRKRAPSRQPPAYENDFEDHNDWNHRRRGAGY